MTFAERLSGLMQRDGVTNYRLSKLVSCSATTVANWLSGKEVTPAYLQRLADLFGVSTDYLLGGNEKAPTQESERTIIEGTYFRLAKGAQDLGLDDDDVDAILNLYKQHKKRNE